MKKAIYATKHKPCPICGKEDWCCFLPSNESVDPEDGLYVCRRCQSRCDIISPVDGSVYLYKKESINGDALFVKQEVVQQKKNRYNLHIKKPVIHRPMKPEPEKPALPNAQLDTIYRQFLSLLPLKESHAAYFQREGWRKEWIQRSLFRSTPEHKEQTYYVKKLKAKVGSLEGVPGFYPKQNSFMGGSGILMPLYDAKGQIFRLRIRFDHPETDSQGKEKNKYNNFSSKGINGCRAGMQIGLMQRPEDEKETFWITEGEKKAAIANFYFHQRVVNLTGVNCFRFLLEPNGTEEPLLPYLIRTGAKLPVIVFDADKYTNPKVMQAQEYLIALLKRYFPKVQVGEWNQGFGKGLDDILLAGILPNLSYV